MKWENLTAQMEEVVVFPTGLWLGDMISSHSMDAVSTAANHKRDYAIMWTMFDNHSCDIENVYAAIG